MQFRKVCLMQEKIQTLEYIPFRFPQQALHHKLRFCHKKKQWISADLQREDIPDISIISFVFSSFIESVSSGPGACGNFRTDTSCAWTVFSKYCI